MKGILAALLLCFALPAGAWESELFLIVANDGQTGAPGSMFTFTLLGGPRVNGVHDSTTQAVAGSVDSTVLVTAPPGVPEPASGAVAAAVLTCVVAWKRRKERV